MNPYTSFLKAPTREHWKHIGLRRRAGVAVPLFSIDSRTSVGVGEIADLKKLAAWCVKTGLSLIQLLPLNDVGFDFCPYDVQSTFALEPLYLSLGRLQGVKQSYQSEITRLRKKFPPGPPRVNYQIKQAKLDLLWEIFKKEGRPRDPAFQDFLRKSQFWLRDYALFKVLKERFKNQRWQDWPEPPRKREAEALQEIERKEAEKIQFHKWLQWQLYEQLREAKQEAARKGVLLMGDLPFLVSRESADVWAHQELFKLDFASGAPPDTYYALGQRWGMPPYDWEKMASQNYDYLIERLRYAEHFYDLYRIDHVIGVFRIWSIPVSAPLEQHGLPGAYDPPDETTWEDHGRKILGVMIEATSMLPCGEDLGTVPECSNRVLEDFAIPGMDVQRWSRDWGKTYDFLDPTRYRKNSVAVISTHDMASLRGWWEFEAGTVDQELLRRRSEAAGLDFEKRRSELFDLKQSSHGRWRWEREISDCAQLLTKLQRREDEVRELVEEYLASFEEREKFSRFLEIRGKPPKKAPPRLIRRALEKAHEASSIFSIQLLTDWFSLDPGFREDAWEFRINFPGTVSEKNWTLVMPYSLEEMQDLKINAAVRKIVQKTNRTA